MKNNLINKYFLQDDSIEMNVLKSRLEEFYAKVDNYIAYNYESSHDNLWSSMISVIKKKYSESNNLNILEIGAGKTGFYKKLAELNFEFSYDIHDINEVNKEHFKKIAHNYYIGDIYCVISQYDVIFSTYVFEHISDPENVLKFLLSKLKKGGTLFIFSPRYDLPFYLSPSAKHYSVPIKLIISTYLIYYKLIQRINGQIKFLVHKDPAIFYKKWQRDFDAIHWVSLNNLKLFCKVNNLNIEEVYIPPSSTFNKFYNKFMLLHVVLSKK